MKDYLKAILSTAGQSGSGAGTGTGLFGADQAPLSAEVRDLALAGVNAIDWCKGGCGGTGGNDNGGGNTDTGGDTTPGDTTPPPGGNTTPPPPPPPTIISNEFTVTSARASGNDILTALRLPGVGRIEIRGRGRFREVVRRNGRRRTRTRNVNVGSVAVNVTRAGDLSARLATTAAARRALAKIKRTGRMTVTLTITYTPAGGTARTVTRTLNLRGRKR